MNNYHLRDIKGVDDIVCIECRKENKNPIAIINISFMLVSHLDCDCYKYYKDRLYCPDCFMQKYFLDRVLNL